MGTMLGVAMPAPGSVAPPEASVPSASPLRSDDRPQLTPRTMLAELIRARGVELAADPTQIEALIFREFEHNVALLTAAQRAGVPEQLQQAAAGEGILSATMRLVSLLAGQGMDVEDARYAIDSWALALGL